MNESEWFSAAFIETCPTAAYACDADGVIVMFNARATEIWGRTPAAGQVAEEFWPWRADLGHPIRHVLRTGLAASDEQETIERPDGACVTVLHSLSPITAGDGRPIGAVGCFQALNAQQRPEPSHDGQAAEALANGNRTTAHEFNNLLQAISFSVEILRLRIAQGRIEEAAGFATRAMTSVDRAVAFTARLLGRPGNAAP